MAFVYYRPQNKPLAQTLRRNETSQERRLWYEFLSRYPVRFRRQKQIGPFIVDFYCAKAKLVVELDGSQHFYVESTINDEARTAYLSKQGLHVLRFTNLEVNQNFDEVCERIDSVVKHRA